MSAARDDSPDPLDVLERYDLPAPERIEPAGGTAGRTWKVTARGKAYFLRLRGARTSTPERLEYDHALRRRLVERGLPTVEAIPTREGERWVKLGDRVFELYPFVEGRLFNFGSREELRAAARGLAQFHLAARDFQPPHPRPLRIAQYAWLGFCDAASDRMDDPALQAANIEAVRGLCADPAARADAEWALARVRRLQETNAGERYERVRGWVAHGDYTPANVLFRSDHELAGVFDFDWAMPCPRVRDIGDALYFFAGRRDRFEPGDIWSLTEAVPFDFDRCAAFLEAYAEIAPLRPDEWAAIPAAFEGRWFSIRLEGMAKVPAEQRIHFFSRGDLHVPIEWLDANWRALACAAAAI